MKQPVVSCTFDIMGGTAVFHGTRVPVQTLLDYLEAGESIDDFLEGFPPVTREHVIAFLQEAKDRTGCGEPGEQTSIGQFPGRHEQIIRNGRRMWRQADQVHHG